MVGIIGALIAVIVGTIYGAIAGYFGGRVRQYYDENCRYFNVHSNICSF